MLIKTKRILRTTFKDLLRNKTVTLSSIAVMSLVFLILSLFTILAFSAVKFLRYVETREHLEIFFNPGTPEDKIMDIKDTLENTGKTAYVKYTTQEEAAEFLRQRHSDNPLILDAISPDSLPASLAVRAKKIDFVQELNSLIQQQDPDDDRIYKIGYNEDTTNLLQDLLFWVKLAGAILFCFLIIVVFLVSLITVEMNIASRAEEISIMQLVGGGNLFIRAPFILSGTIYGMAGAFIATSLITGAGIALYFIKDQSPTLSFLARFFADLDWPEVNIPIIIGIFLVEITLGGILGSINTLIAVWRRLK